MFQDDPVNGLLQSRVSKFCKKKKKKSVGSFNWQNPFIYVVSKTTSTNFLGRLKGNFTTNVKWPFASLVSEPFWNRILMIRTQVFPRHIRTCFWHCDWIIPDEHWYQMKTASQKSCVSGICLLFIEECSSISSLAILSSRLTVFQRAKDILYTCYSSVCSIHLVKQITDCLAFHWIKHILANKGHYPKQKEYNYYMRSGLCVTPALSKRAR